MIAAYHSIRTILVLEKRNRDLPYLSLRQRLTGYVVKSFRYLLTASRQFDILHPALAGGDRMAFDQLKRREFITLLGGAAAAWPLAARAQQAERMRRIGVLMLYPENDPEGQLRATGLRNGLQKRGWAVG